MIKKLLPLPLLAMAMAIAFAVTGEEKKEPKKVADKGSIFDKFKQLEGEWVGKAGEDPSKTKDSKITYKVTSGGTAVVETIDPAGPHEMVTIITKDGEGLALTHYCMLGNQPHMKADLGNGEKVAFKFVNGGNMKSDKELHMHGVTYTFIDKDTFKAEWVSCDGGKEGGPMVFEMKRKK